MELRPITLDQARAYVAAHHRHSRAPESWRFGCGLYKGDRLVGVAMAGRPSARALDDGRTIEVTRICTLGDRNACSRLYGAVLRAAAALGYRTAYTYTLATEPGSSPRAVGFEFDGEVAAREHHGGRSRYSENLFGEQQRPPEAKHRWRKEL